MDRDTQIVHAGFRKRTEPGPFLAGPQFSSTYTSPGEPSDNALTYGRFHNPTWTAWEEALRVLEDGEAVAFASGMAAVDAVFGTTPRPAGWRRSASRCGSCRRAETRRRRRSTAQSWCGWRRRPIRSLTSVTSPR